jgi:hypothetical protein
VQHTDRTERVAQVLEGKELRPLLLGVVPAPLLAQREETHRAVRGDAHRAGGEPLQAEVAQVHDRRPLADAAHDELPVDDVEQRAEIDVLARIGAHRRVLDAGDEPVVHERRDLARLEIAVRLDVHDHRLAEPLREAADAGHDAVAGGRKRERKDHHGRKAASPQRRELIDQLPEVGTDGWDDPRVVARLLLEHVEDLAQLARTDVVQVGVPAVQQRADAALLEVLDERAIVGAADRQVAMPRERRHGDDGGGEVGGADRGRLHSGSGEWRVGGVG